MTTFIDNSTLASFAKCPSQAILRYHLGYTTEEESHALQAGSAIHTSLECYYKGGQVQQALELFGRAYEEYSEQNIGPKDRLHYTNLEKVMRAWYTTHPKEELPYKIHPEFVEIGFNYPLCKDIVLVGRLDALVSSWDERWWYPLDHKSTKRIDDMWVRDFQLGSQMSGYIWGASQMMENVVGAYINGIETSKLPSDPKRKCSTHGVKYVECSLAHMNSELFITQRTAEELAEWKRTAIHLAKRWVRLTQQIERPEDIHKALMLGTFNGSCRYCESYDWCTQGRPASLVKNLFVYKPWVPHEGLVEP